MSTRQRICFVVAAPITAEVFLKNHIKFLSDYYDIYLVANFDNCTLNADLNLCGHKSIRIVRKINPLNDLIALIKLIAYFKKMKFTVIHSVTPKAGLLSAIAGFVTKVPFRIHIFTGQVWSTKKGIGRIILMNLDRLISHLNTNILVDGESQRRFLIQNHIITFENSSVLGKGSISGVNTEIFSPNPFVKKTLRDTIGIQGDKITFIFLGRLTFDKGLIELFSAFNKLALQYKNVFLLIVGIDEDNIISHVKTFEGINPGINFHYFGKTSNPENILQAGDIFCLPSYREGFGTSVIEASCLGLPVICSDTYGILDAMEDNVTGLRCKTKDAVSLYLQMEKLLLNQNLRQDLGINGRKNVLDNFDSRQISSEWLKFYQELIKS